MLTPNATLKEEFLDIIHAATSKQPIENMEQVRRSNFNYIDMWCELSNISAIVETLFTTINRNVGKYDSVINNQWYNGKGWKKWVIVQFNNAIPYYELMKGDNKVYGVSHSPNRRQQFTFFPLPVEHIHMYTPEFSKNVKNN